MKNRILFVVGGLVAVLIFAVIAWYLASPLFIDNKVNEAFPFEIPGAEEMAAMSSEERAMKQNELMEAMPTEAELAALSPAEREMVQQNVAEAEAVVMPDKEMDEAMPAGPTALLIGHFMDADSFHQGSGTATLFQASDGLLILRLEDFEATNGPDLHVVLSSHPDPANHDQLGDNYLDLGSLKGNIGNQNYDVPAGTDLSAYQSVVIYCKPFQVVFATATLQQP